MLRTLLAAGAALVVMCAFSVTPAGAAPLLTLAGPGFQVAARLGTTSVSPSRPYVVTFGSARLKRRYAPYLRAAVAQIRAAGVRIAVGGTESGADTRGCPPWGHIRYTESYRPMGHGGYSRGVPCPARAGVAAGGEVTMDSEYFDGSWHIAPHQLRNTVVHELLHTLGLAHPNRDLDGDGTARAYECVTGPGGLRPVMCSPNGGHATPGEAGRLTPHDMAGLRAMLANARRAGVR